MSQHSSISNATEVLNVYLQLKKEDISKITLSKVISKPLAMEVENCLTQRLFFLIPFDKIALNKCKISSV